MYHQQDMALAEDLLASLPLEDQASIRKVMVLRNNTLAVFRLGDASVPGVFLHGETEYVVRDCPLRRWF